MQTQQIKKQSSPFPLMNKAFAKFSVFLIIFANISPALAISKPQNILSSQPIIVAGLFKNLNRGLQTIDRVERQQDAARRREEQRKLREQRREQRFLERQAREEKIRRRAEEYAEARRRATQRQLEEAEKRRRYFESLSPKQQQAYIRQQQQLRQKQLEARLFLLGWGMKLLMNSGSASGSSQPTSNPQYIYEERHRPTYNPAPNPTQPIHPNYGSCHHYSC
ncbi:MAG: hypothetical protein IGS39_04985 [Calothrix sp. C42_A2020_038]|nr:hypothetical protein [Calothrix sp. C42_A2020_038]